LSLITLTSDLGYNNFSLAEFKARFLSAFPQHQIIDLFHHHDAFDIESIGYQLLGALNTFPENSIHVVFNKYVVQNSDILILKINNQYVLTPNNGLVSLIHSLDYNAKVFQLSFTVSNVWKSWIDAVQAILVGSIPVTAIETNQFIQTKPFNTDLHFMDDRIITRVIHTDTLGNIILNIQKEEFYHYLNNRAFYLSFIGTKIYQLSPNYSTTYNPNRIGALFNATGFIELFMIGGNLAELFNINKWKNNKFEIIIDNDTNREINFQPRA
jgi:S-adenosylmethionine hydrolase